MTKNIEMPHNIQAALETGAHLVVSISGGKDSDCMAYELFQMRTIYDWSGRFILIHADLGLMEWPQSKPHCEDLAEELDVEFVTVGRDGGLLGHIKRRVETLASQKRDVPAWPSSAARYCTSDMKRSPIDKWIRNEFPEDETVICAMGLRAEESPARAKREGCSLRTKASAPTKNRTVYDWLPIKDFAESDVWATLGLSLSELQATQKEVQASIDSGVAPLDAIPDTWTAHPAYALGNERVSCALCVLASKNDLDNGAATNPELLAELISIEQETRFGFRRDFWLSVEYA